MLLDKWSQSASIVHVKNNGDVANVLKNCHPVSNVTGIFMMTGCAPVGGSLSSLTMLLSSRPLAMALVLAVALVRKGTISPL